MAIPCVAAQGYGPAAPPGSPALEAGPGKGDVLGMQRDRDEDRVWQVEVLPASGDRRRGTPLPRGSRALATVTLVAAIAAGLGILALLVVFAATIAMIAVPVAVGAALIAWAGTKWRAYAARRDR
jgi:hypothetical protein